jgi:chromosome segregation ATPase
MKKWKLYGSVLVCVAITGCATSGDLEDLKIGIQKENTAMELKLNSKIDKNQLELNEGIDNLQSDLDTKIALINDKLDLIAEQMALSRNIQSVQITFNNLKKKIEESEARVINYNNRIEALKAEITKSSSSNQNIQQEIGEIEGKMDELIQVLEAQGE